MKSKKGRSEKELGSNLAELIETDGRYNLSG